MFPASLRRPHVVRLLSFLLPIAALPFTFFFGGDLLGGIGNLFAGAPPPRAELVNVPGREPGGAPVRFTLDSLTGRSGHLRVSLLTREDVEAIPSLTRKFGSAALRPGIRTVGFRTDGGEFAFVTLKPWREKKGTFINAYHVGWWPGERRLMPDNYQNPEGFVEVTEDRADLRVSTHFYLRDFLTHDQALVWPKYVVLREELLDKLELVLATLEAQGVDSRHAHVLSGFRTPQYNQRVTAEGAAYASRHQFGDAADVIIDSDGNGRMDDLNRDGVVDFRDTDVINRAVERVERQYPELVGGLGLYRATGPSGPFAHIDVRGTRARWTNLVSAGRTARSVRPTVRNLELTSASSAPASQASAVGKCRAEGPMAALCTGVR
jgi:uncharacterized protein YcbK (DUF882 family)